MKKLVLLLASSLICVFTIAQISEVKIDSEKQYENATRTTYLSLDGYYGSELTEGISAHLNSHPDILLFSFYDETNPKKCMYTANNSLNKSILVEIINDFLSGYYQFDMSDDLPYTKYFANVKTVKFNVSGIVDDNHKTQIISTLSLLNFVSEIKINQQNICKISISKTTKGSVIRAVFDELNLEIIESINN